MKQNKFLIGLLALIGLASCNQDDDFGRLQESETNRVVITANADTGIGNSLKSSPQTRASGNLQLSGYSLRYILEVREDGTNVLQLREERLVSDASQSVTFDFDIADAGDYDVLLWADYIESGANFTNEHYDDLYYETNGTNGLMNISIIGANYAVNTASRDAFSGSVSFTKAANSAVELGSVTLTRPFGRVNVTEKDAALLTKLTALNIAYDVPSSFNVLDGSVSNTSHSVAISISDMTSLPTAAVETANLFFDYIFAPASGQHLLGGIEIAYTHDGKNRSFTIPANMPIERNKRTNISGSILANNNAVGLSVVVNDLWSDSDIDEIIAVGYYYYEGGLFSNQYNSSLNCLGVVFETDGTSGKIVSLNQENLAWSPTNITKIGTTTDDGLENMEIVKTHVGNFADYPAFEWVDAKNSSGTIYTSGLKGVWYLPTVNELEVLYNAFNVNQTEFNLILTTAGGNVINTYTYLSSVESTSEPNASISAYSFQSGTSGASLKKTVLNVRAVMAF